MKKTLSLICGLLALHSATAQNPVIPGNIINNCGFENYTTPLPYNSGTITNATGWYDGCAWGNINGTLGTPDLITNDPSVGVFAKIPLMGHVAARNNGLTNNSFAAIGGMGPTATYPELYGESIMTGLNENLSEDYVYTFSAWTGVWYYNNITPPVFQMQVVLRKPNNCTDSKVVFTSGNVPVLNRGADGVVTSNWSQITGTFVLDAADVAQGYSLIEIRLTDGTAPTRVGIDDVSLTKVLRPKAAFSFVNIGQTYTTAYSNQWGNVPITQMCAAPAPAETQVLINGSASSNEQSYRITVQEWDVLNWTAVGAPLFNQWITPYTQVPTADINLSNLAGVTIQPGKTYRVILGVGHVVHDVSQLIRINPLPTIDVPATATICNGDAASISVNATWPVKVYRGSTLVGTYSSSPISLSPTTTTTYTFTTTTQYGCSASDQIAITVNNCPRASFVFENVSAVVNEGPTQYGYVPVTQLCAPNVIIDGTASTYETSYWVDVETMNISNWTMGPYLYSGWTSGQINGDINLLTLIQQNNPTFNFQVGQIYNVGISLSPTSPYSSVNKLFRVVNCAKSLGGMELEEVSSDNSVHSSVTVFPNPSNGTFKVTFDQLMAQKVVVTNLLGEEVYNSDISDEIASLSIDLSDRPAGVYMLHVKQSNGETILEKIVKN
jgi:hypothetical protein